MFIGDVGSRIADGAERNRVAAGGGAATIIGGAFAAIGNTVVDSASIPGRIMATAGPATAGAGIYFTASRLLPQGIADQIPSNVWVPGILAYFFLTQLYLNLSSEEGQEWAMETQFALMGFVIAATVDTVFRRTQPAIEAEAETLLNEDYDLFDDDLQPSRRYALLTGTTTSLPFRVGYRALMASGLFVGAAYTENHLTVSFLRNFGAFYIGQAVSILLMAPFSRWSERQEEDFDSNNDPFKKLPPALERFRIFRNVAPILAPALAAGLFAKPEWFTLGPAGLIHAIGEECRKIGFQRMTPEKAECVASRILCCGFRADRVATSAKIALFVGSGALFVYFTAEVIESGNPVEIAAWSTFLGSTILGYVKNTLLKYRFKESTSRLGNELFYNGAYSLNDVLGMNSNYLYIYSLFSGMKIGSETLSDLTFNEALLLLAIWGGYGWRMGGNLARADTPSDWLAANYGIEIVDALKGIIRS